MKFQLVKTVATPAALEALAEANQQPLAFLARHARGDWGECDPEDAAANDDAVQHGDRITSIYRPSKGTKIWIIIEADRSVTTVLLPEDY